MGKSPLFQQNILITDEDFVNETLGTKKKKENIELFLKYMNALLNEGWGAVYVHFKDPFQLGRFDEAVDQKMLKLIPDDTFFHENFERHYHDDHHVIFRVIQRKRPMSTLSFNTRILTDTGFTEPTHGQIREFFSRTRKIAKQKRKLDQQHETPVSSERLIFIKDRVVVIETTDENSKTKQNPFQESMRAQAKGVKKELCSKTGQQLVTDLVTYCLDDLSTHSYMSAFSKLPTGGSLYIGVYEEKKEADKWTIMDMPEICHHLHILGNPRLKLFKDKKEEDVYHIATDTKVPTLTQMKSGKFKPAGVMLTLSEQANFKKELLAGLKRKIKMVAAASFCPQQSGARNAETEQEPIDVKFHNVQGTDTFVIEIHSDKFSGACFTDPAGPLAYRCIFPESGPVETEPFPIDVWFAKNIKDI